MISFEKECIFVHVPKTGGMSVEDAIWGPDRNQRTTEQLWRGNIRPGYNKYQTGGLQHLLASQIRQEVGDEKFSNYFKFSFVRNPWDKVVSQFHYLKTRPLLLKFMGLGKWSSFGRYVKLIARNPEIHVQTFPQWKFVLDDLGNSLVDFIGRFENLAEDFKVVASRIGLDDQELPHVNKTAKRRHYVEYYNKRTRELVTETYAKDIELFGYDFGK